MKYKVAQTIGLNTDQVAAQVLSSATEPDNLFLAVLKLTCDDAFTKGRQMLSEFADYFTEADGDTAQRLTATYSHSKQELSRVGEFDLLLAAVSGKVLYLIFKGATGAYLKRLGEVSALHGVGSQEQVISGFLQEGDRLLFSTNSLTGFLGEKLAVVLEMTREDWEEEMSAKLAVDGLEAQGLSGLIVDIEPDEVVEIPKTVAQEAIVLAGRKGLNFDLRSKLESVLARLKSLRVFFPKSGRGRLILAVVLILVLLFGVGLKYKQNKDKAREATVAQLVSQARDEFNAAQNLQTLNPAEAKSSLDAAKADLGKALKLDPNSAQAKSLKQQIESQTGIGGQYQINNFPVFLDLNLIKNGFTSDHLSLSVGKLLVLDPNTKTLVEINTDKKSQTILAGKDTLGDAQLASLNGNFAFVYSKDKGIIRIDTTDQNDLQVSKADSDWGSIADIEGFAGNVYLLDKIGPHIWKYLPTESGYADKRDYLSADVKTDLTNARRMQIESSVYVLKNDGGMDRFTRGESDFFSIGGLDKPLNNPKSFYVSSDTDNLYILDSGNSRLVVVNKTGAYQAEYQGSLFATATDLAVDEEAKKVYLLESSKIYSVELK